MGRPKKYGDTINVSLRMNPEVWDNLQILAQIFGMNRTELLNAIANGEITLEKKSGDSTLVIYNILKRLLLLENSYAAYRKKHEQLIKDWLDGSISETQMLDEELEKMRHEVQRMIRTVEDADNS